MFETGDAIVHPIRGAGIVTSVEERQLRGDKAIYYRIKLLGQPGTNLILPVKAAEKVGLRHAVSLSKLRQVWRVLGSTPETLPSEHKERYKVLHEKMHTGDILQVAEAVRDMAWRRETEGNLTTRGKRIYQESMMLLAGEIAATQDISVMDAEDQIQAKLEGD